MGDSLRWMAHQEVRHALEEDDAHDRTSKLIGLYHTRLWSMTELCARFGIKRKTGYKCYTAAGLWGLRQKPRVPRRCPHRIAPDLAAVLLGTTRLHPSWGPLEILPYVARYHPALALPAASSPGELFRKAGLLGPRRAGAIMP
jgi:hypothetical protein